jgi:hypothetical protein
MSASVEAEMIAGEANELDMSIDDHLLSVLQFHMDDDWRILWCLRSVINVGDDRLAM